MAENRDMQTLGESHGQAQGRRISRRSAMAGATLPALPFLAAAQDPAPDGSERRADWPTFGRKIRVGMVGLEGHPGLVLDVTAHHPDLELVAIARDTVPVDGVKRRKEFQNTRIYNDYREMFAKEQFDVVGACNTNGHRAEVILAATAKGWHVLAEKPVALTREELDAVRTATQKPGLAFTSLLPMRYEPPLYTMGMMVREGAIGDVLLMNGQKSYKLGSRPQWFKQRDLYGSTMLWIGVHQLDLMHWVSGQRFSAVYSYEQNVQAPGYGEMENICGAVMHLENGGVATLSMDYHRPDSASTHGDDRLRVVGTKGILEYRIADGLMLLSQNGSALESPTLRHPPLPLFLDFLTEAYLGGQMLIRRDEVFHVVETLIAARDSDIHGRRVELPIESHATKK
ncbi:MAG: Gfo/Idh/MocA family oxidoreductase [Bryobacterales bacterium]|nr:Gfo/Idh/MocA family oxidoreductase [Bryobacterales bacterium]